MDVTTTSVRTIGGREITFRWHSSAREWRSSLHSKHGHGVLYGPTAATFREAEAKVRRIFKTHPGETGFHVRRSR